MNILKNKRYGKVMTKEVEETVISFENQLEYLSNENDKLKSKVKNLEEEIYLLQEQNKMYKELIDKNGLNIEDKKDIQIDNEVNNVLPKPIHAWQMLCSDDETIENNDKKIDNKYKELEKELNKFKEDNESLIIEIKDLKQDYIKIQNDNKDIYKNPEFIRLQLEKEEIEEKNNEKFEKLNETIDLLRTQINGIPSEEQIKNKLEKEIETKYKNIYEEKLNKEKNKKSRKKESSSNNENPNIEKIDKSSELLRRYPIIIYKDINGSEVKNMVASECSFLVKYQYEVSTKTNKKDEISINEVVDYIIKQEKLSSQEKNRLLNKYERCEYLHNTYKDKLNIFKFELNHISVMTKEEWKIWLNEIHKLIKQEYPNEVSENVIFNKCDYVYTKGKNKGEKCNKVECRTKSHKVKTKIH